MTYKTIASPYVNVISNFGNATVEFDSYPDVQSIEDNVHKPRKLGKNNSPTIAFTNDMLFHTKRDLFLGNNVNNLLSIEFNKSRCSLIHAKNDADVDIVKAVVKSSESYHTTLIGEDTDLFIIILL